MSKKAARSGAKKTTKATRKAGTKKSATAPRRAANRLDATDVRSVTFPSGESLAVVTAPDRPGQEHYDPNDSRNPLLDTSGENRAKKLSRSFTAGELAKSGERIFNIARIDPKLIECLQAIRDHVGRPVIVNSGYRSYKYNKEIYEARGKRPTKSQHISGRGADIRVEGMSGVEIAKAAIDAAGCEVAVGLGASFAHVDTRGRFAVWNYGGVTERQIEEVQRYHDTRCGQ